jgi:uncharacterized DUF497 family protein
MRFQFEMEKSREEKRKHGISLDEAQETFDRAYLADQKSDDPEQFSANETGGTKLCRTSISAGRRP